MLVAHTAPMTGPRLVQIHRELEEAARLNGDARFLRSLVPE